MYDEGKEEGYMSEKDKDTAKCAAKCECGSKCRCGRRVRAGDTGGIWFAGFIGALVYFLHFHSGTFWLVLVAIFKAIFWPVYLVYYLFKFLGL